MVNMGDRVCYAQKDIWSTASATAFTAERYGCRFEATTGEHS